LREFIAYAKANPGKVNYGSSGVGSTLHLTMEMLAGAAGLRLVHVPYTGAAPALNDLLAGHIDLMIDNLGNSLPLVREGKLRPLAIASPPRIPELPDVPAIAELFPGFYSSGWFGVVAPPNTPRPIADKLSQAIADVVKLPDVARRYSELAVQPAGMTPAQMSKFVREESERWGQVIAKSGIKPH
jgi:tripartite-type tricarboxylate transporter receptor subunit TctC